ncbi:uncharacterized protein [Chironomus tepperi]|uniref:uncharacterized protein n=1 Tax=Chironomus tepperi TaxID=113505 RepID=UPI00391EFBC5
MVNKKFCCCCDLKIGSCIYVGLTLLSSIFQLLNIGSFKRNDYEPYEYSGYGGYSSDFSYELREFEELRNSPQYKIMSFFDSIAYIFLCILFFVGVNMKSPCLLLPFIVLQTIELILGLFLLVMMFFTLPKVSFFLLVIYVLMCCLVYDVYSYYVTMKNEPAEPVYAPQVVVRQQMPQYGQPQYVYYPAPTASTNQQGPMGAVPMFYAPQPYNPNVCASTADGTNSMPSSNNVVTDNSTNINEKVPEQNKE